MSSIGRRISQVLGLMESSPKPSDELPWDPDHTSFPTRKNLPDIPGAPKDAAWVWGKDDNVSWTYILFSSFCVLLD